MRCNDAGMVCVSMHDPTGRRGIWYRTETTPTLCTRTASTYPAVTEVEIVAGREGDDEAVTMRVGDTITLEMLHRLEGCLRVGAWMLEEAAERARIACDVCAPTTALSTGTPRVPAHERPTCCPWYSEHEWCATARPAPAAGPTGTRTGSEGR